jgi:chemotaxis family two-component system sensor kinase Cph1
VARKIAVLTKTLSMVEALHAGDHAALLYETRAEQFAWSIPFLKIGLARNERCLYIADGNSVPMILRRLAEAGVNVDEAQDRDALRVVTKRETYLKDGGFEPTRMIAELSALERDSLRKGFTALRATGEMTWALDSPSFLEKLAEYEKKLDDGFSKNVVALCQYDKNRFSEDLIFELARIHPKIIVRGELLITANYTTSRLNVELATRQA